LKTAITEVREHLGALPNPLEAEVEAYISSLTHEIDEHGHRLVVRNGHAEPRSLVTGAGPLLVRAPRVDDRRVDEGTGEKMRFRSSASVITRLTTDWQRERDQFARRSRKDVDYVYLWADGIHFRVRLDEACLCVRTWRFISARRLWSRASATVMILTTSVRCWRCWGRNSTVVRNMGQVRQALACGQAFCAGRPQKPLGRACVARPSRCLAQAASASGRRGRWGRLGR
jgi:hypothetical protein